MKGDPNSQFLWPIFSRIRPENGDLQSKPPYSVRMRENTDENKLQTQKLFTQYLKHKKETHPVETYLLNVQVKHIFSYLLKEHKKETFFFLCKNV